MISSIKETIKKYPIGSFLIINYIISWSFLYPSYQMILANDGITPLSLIGLIGAYGPTIAAIIVQAVIDKSRLKTLLRKLIQFKCGIITYVYVVLLPISLYGIAYAGSIIYHQEVLSFNIAAGLSSIPFWFLAALPFGPMGEELGWRGFMMPRLLEKYSVEVSTIFVGLAWGFWHLASFTFPGAAIPEFLPVTGWTVGLYFLNTISLSFIFTYIYLKSKGSVLSAILLHAFFNAASNITINFLPETTATDIQTLAYIGNIILVAITGLVLLKTLSRNEIKPFKFVD